MTILVHDSKLVNTIWGIHADGMESIGSRIGNRRRSMRLTQAELASRSGVAQAVISRIETGVYKETPPPEVLSPLARSLDFRDIDLLEALGYDVSCDDDEPTETELVRRIRTVTDQWTPRQREIVWKLIENANALREPDQATG